MQINSFGNSKLRGDVTGVVGDSVLVMLQFSKGTKVMATGGWVHCFQHGCIVSNIVTSLFSILLRNNRNNWTTFKYSAMNTAIHSSIITVFSVQSTMAGTKDTTQIKLYTMACFLLRVWEKSNGNSVLGHSCYICSS